jgi:hypothetical protein
MCSGHVPDELMHPFKRPNVPALHPSSARFIAILDEIKSMHLKKMADYGKPGDPFANVRASVGFGVSAWIGAMIRANDKVARLQSLATTGKLTNEGAQDSFLDLASYAIIALVLYEETIVR